ncbi:Wzz/FepE/Etk N-terminal domain-containing protein [Nitrospira sp. NS4]|uniref:Wzz/FepE/Etk N-terminal domain-containing protein n=1 Tax=Nitrospira sp. NS4 TaxID=3414498 RepID=UPI003C2B6DA0
MGGVEMTGGRAPQGARTVDAPGKDVHDYLAQLRRRKTLILTVAAALFAASAALAFLLPAVYRSTATILIEEQEIPPDLVRSAIATYADQRIETIKQQVLSRSTLWKIVEQYDLYKDLRKRNPTEEVLGRFVKDIQIDVMNVKVIDRRTQNPTQATIAFTLAYDGESPELAQKVANELTSLFLGENLKTRERHAQETTSFLKRESENLSHHIQEVEQKLAEVKQRAEGALPELVQLNMQLMSQVQREVIDTDRDIRSLKERKTYLEGELASLKPHTPIISASGERLLDTGERLKALRAQYASMSAYLSPEHPDIIKMKQELSSLEKEPGATDGRDELSKRLMAERASLADLLERLGEAHPDVVRSQGVVASLERELQAATAKPQKLSSVKPENPAYINIQSQLASTTASLQSLEAARGDLKRRMAEYAKRVETTPTVEPEYLDLVRDRDNSVRKYQEITSRLMEAQVSGELEVQRKGERFSLINPPELPEKPDRPNRLAIVLLGAFLAVAGGVGTGMAADNVDRTIHTAEQLARAMGTAPLAVIPYLPSEDEVAHLVRRRAAFGLAGLGVLVVGAVILHLAWMPLDVLWYSIWRKLG